jgi:hypothetical protein
MSRPRFGLKVTYRLYQCLNCGNVQPMQTNHTDVVLDYCKNCSWKPSFGKKEYAIPMFGRTYRPFKYYGIYRPLSK